MFSMRSALLYLMRIQVAVVILAFAVLYAPVSQTLVHTWWGTSGGDEYGHGFIVVLISLYLVWRQRGVLARLQVAPHLSAGVFVTLFAALLLLVGGLTTTAVLEEISLLVMLAGLLLLLAGTAFFKTLALPLGFLVFAIPVFDELIGAIHWPFQLLAANIGSWLIGLFGIPVFLEAQYIHLPRITLEVAEVCSGIRYLISVIALGIPLAYLTQPTWWRRTSLVTFAIAIAIAANAFRVALIGIWVEYFGAGIIHGPYHILQGLFVSWIGFAAIFAGMWFLGRRPSVPKHPDPASEQASGRLVHQICQESRGEV